jgi:hypothetical protein
MNKTLFGFPIVESDELKQPGELKLGGPLIREPNGATVTTADGSICEYCHGTGFPLPKHTEMCPYHPIGG